MSGANSNSSVRRMLAAAGRAIGRSQASERGTVLLMVIGVLAMMSIVALVYASIGQADRRSAASLARESRLDDQAQTIADYFAGVLSADLFSYHEDRETGRLHREVTDYPSSNPLAVSQEPNAANDEVLFDPVGYDGYDPWLASSEPGFVGGRPRRVPGDASQWYLDNEDWAHISNLSPNGRFVNLVELRNNFNAEPGVDRNPTTNRFRLSERLTLFGNNGRAQNHTGPQLRPDGVTADRDFPYDWTANQIFLYRPAVDIDQRNDAPRPGQPEYALNQYADTDGDGMLDARWFELLGRDPNTGTDLFPAVQFTGPARLFVAARVLDLSGLVNVNTATEFELRPDRTVPVGLHPSEIDLRRLLRMADFYDLYTVAYDGYENPFGSSQITPGHYGDYDEELAAAMGSAAYTALRLAMQSGPVPRNAAPGVVNPPSSLTAIARGEHYRRFGRDVHGGGNAGAAGGGGIFNRWSGRPFGIADELELRAFHGANDPTSLSRLEATVAGRRIAADPVAPFCPLRSNRAAEFERGGRGDLFPMGQSRPGTVADGRADDEALLQSATDIRRLLTTYSGPRLLRPVEVNNSNMDSLLPSDVRLDLGQTLMDIAGFAPNNPNENRQNLFATIALALMPHTAGDDNPRAWDPANAEHDSYLPLAYGGRGPQLALLCASHLTANLLDSFDQINPAATEDPPTALVVNLRTGNAPVVPTNHNLLNLDDIRPPGLPTSEMIPPRLHPNPAVVGTEAREARIYGIEAQLFLTDIAMFTIFTDAPTGSGGDQEWTDGIGDPPGPVEPGKVTINTRIRNGDTNPNAPNNPDFIMQVIAFQVYNPFEEDIDLADYYFQFGRMRFEFTGTEPKIVAPREHRTVFCTNPGRAEIQARRWGPLTTGPTLNQWLSTQLGYPTNADIDANELERFKPLSTMAIPANEIEDFLEAPVWSGAVPPPVTPENRVALLWKKFGDAASRDDDILIDRLRDPVLLTERPTLDRRFEMTDDVIGNTTALEESDASAANDNTGFSLLLYGTMRRPADRRGGGAVPSIPVGAMPMFCIERKDGPGQRLNAEDTDGFTLTTPVSMSEDDFLREGGTRTFDALINDTAYNPLQDVRVARDPKANDPTTSPDPATFHPLGIPYDQLYPEIHLNNNNFAAGMTPDVYQTLRIGDVLLPLAIGPQRLIIFAPPPDPQLPHPINELEAEWTTLSEALAIATGYGNDPLTGGATNPNYRLGIDVLDRGHLKLDAFAPFYKQNPPTPADFTQPWEFIPDEDFRRFPGIPLAQHLIGQFRPEKSGSDRKLVPGMININTAPLAVLRLLPMLTPARDYNGPTGWMNDTAAAQTEGGTPANLYPGPGGAARYDVAAMVKAYRDKTTVLTRGTTYPSHISADGVELDFSDDPAVTPPDGRFERTRIQALREQPGFAGVGEILSVMKRGVDGAGRPTFDHADADLDNSIVRFGYAAATPPPNTETTADIPGIDSTVYKDPADTTGNTYIPDEIINDYDEQLTLANAVLNSISTRSDVFCVWFVVHGYLPSDVEGLGNDDPMIPSIARRYMMVVDRSNVIRRGEKPKILLFQELPL